MAIKEYGREYFWGTCRRLLEKIVPITSSLYKLFYLNAYKLQSRSRNKRKEKFSFQVHIVDSCNLNCVGCSTFAPLCKNSFIDINSFERDIKQITALGQVEKMLLIGGEPLLHPNIIDIIEISRRYIKTSELLIATNGILLIEQNPKFWESCKTNNVKITITPYPINLNYERINKIAKEYSVDLTFFYIGDKISFVKIPLNIEGKGNIGETFKKCSSSHCVTLREGKIYTCYRPSLIDFFNDYFGQNFKVSEKDYVDIFAAKDKDEILDFMCNPTPFCRYCDVDSMKFGIKWGISKKEIGEWIKNFTVSVK